MNRPARRRFLGLDLAWSARNPSGLAVVDECGAVLESRADLACDDDILAWTRGHLAVACEPGDAVVLGIDMPTIVTNPAGTRACERLVRAEFARYHAGPHPANLARFPDGGRARALLDALEASDGVRERLDVAPRTAGRFAFEVFPHPALVRLFALERIFRYKKKSGRAWDVVLSEWARYRASLATLEQAEPPLVLPRDFPERVGSTRYKAWDDRIDAIACAYVASYLWRWGVPSARVAVFGDLTDGYIVVPAEAVRIPPAAVPSAPV